MKLKLKILTFLLMGFLLVSAISFAAAEPGDDSSDDHDEDDDSIDDSYEEEEERKIEIEVESDKVEINSISENKDQQNKFEIDVELSDYVEVSVGFSTETESETNGSEIEEESEFEFKVKFKRIVEFVDLNNNSIYDGNTVDTLIQEYEFNSFNPIEYTTEILPSNNTLHYLLISSSDDVFKLHLYVVEEFEIVNGTLVTPLEAKLDIEITNFNYLEMQSQLALYVTLESEFEYSYEEETHDEQEGWSEDHEDGYSTELSGETGFFTWDDFAMVDGVQKSVEFTPISNDDDAPEHDKIFFNYARGTHIYHDPKIGYAVLFSATPPNWLIIGLISGGVVAAIAIVSIIFMAKKRK